MLKPLIWVLILEGITLNVTGQAWVPVYSGYSSGWSYYEYAPKGYLACGIAVTDDPYNSNTSYDNTSLNTLKVYWCRMKDWTLKTSSIIFQGNYGSWKPDVMCPSGYFVSGMSAKVLPVQNSGDDMDITGIEIKCKNPYTEITSFQSADYSPVGTWQPMTEDSTLYIFGAQGRYDGTTKGPNKDSRGLTGIMIHFSEFCVPTIADCEYCTASDPCTECSPGYFLLASGSARSCNNPCPSGFRGNSTLVPNKCVACGVTNCDTCPTSSTCTVCKLNLLVDASTTPNKCVSTCPSGYIADLVTNLCLICGITNCATCPTISSCTACKLNFYFDNSTGSTQCVSTCPSGYRVDLVTKSCVICGIANCGTCPTNSSCTECSSNFFLDNSTGVLGCVICPEGYRGDSVTKSCIACGVQHCAICQTDSTCTECKLSYFLNTVGGITTCEKPCPSGYFGDTSLTPNSCTRCNVINCSSCNTFDTCDACDSEYYLHDIDNIYTCESFCPVGFAIDHGSNPKSCVRCYIPNCEMCPTLNTCIGCKSGYYLSSLIDNISCEKICPEGYKPSNTLGICDPCEGERCEECPEGYAVISEEPLICTLKIENCRYYEYGVESYICKECNTGYRSGSSGLCDSCEDYYFNIDSNGLVCKPSIPYCLDYDASNESLQCNSCEKGYKLDSTYHCSSCEVGYIQKDSICVRIIRNCKEYELYENNWVCSSCELGYDLDEQRECNKCVQGYIYGNNSSLECIPEIDIPDDNTDIDSQEEEDAISEIQKQRGEQIESYNSIAITVTSASTSVASLLSLDSNTIIDYINSIMLISLIQYHVIDLPYEVQKQQKSTNDSMSKSNIFSYMKIQDKKLDEYIRMKLDDEYSFIAQTIYNWMILGFLLFLNFSIYCLSRFGRGKLKVLGTKALDYLKSSLYIQLFMVNYLDLTHYAILKLINVIYIQPVDHSFWNVLDYNLACVCAVIYIQVSCAASPFLLISILKAKLSHKNQSRFIREGYLWNKYNDSIPSLYYHTLFLRRRFRIVISILLLNRFPYFQIATSSLSCLAVIIIVGTYSFDYC